MLSKDLSRNAANRVIDTPDGSGTVAMLGNRRLMMGLFLAIAVHLGISAAGYSAWRCPVESFAGIPCPGCGLSTATIWLLSGNWQDAMAMHPLAPLALFGTLLCGSLAILPIGYHRKMVNLIAVTDKKLKLFFFLMGTVYIHWIIQMVKFWS